LSAALPSALRARFQEYIEEGLSGRAAAGRRKVSAATGVLWQRKLREAGSVRSEVQGRPAGHGKLAAHRALLEELMAQDGDITLPELAGALEAATGVSCPCRIHWAVPAQAGGHLQKKSLVATERLRARVKHLRHDWFQHRIPAMLAHPDRLVFIPSHRCKQRLPGSGRNFGQNQPDPAAGT
jgi:transposase